MASHGYRDGTCIDRVAQTWSWVVLMLVRVGGVAGRLVVSASVTSQPAAGRDDSIDNLTT